jgi:hypothetical protein
VAGGMGTIDKQKYIYLGNKREGVTEQPVVAKLY